MREPTSASCFWPSALLSGEAKWASGTLDRSRCGLTRAAAGDTATWEWMSMVTLLGRISRPGRPCDRAAVRSYLFHWVIAVPLSSGAFAVRLERAPEQRPRRVGAVERPQGAALDLPPVGGARELPPIGADAMDAEPARGAV